MQHALFPEPQLLTACVQESAGDGADCVAARGGEEGGAPSLARQADVGSTKIPFTLVSLNRDTVPCCPQCWPMVLLLLLLLCFAKEMLLSMQKIGGTLSFQGDELRPCVFCRNIRSHVTNRHRRKAEQSWRQKPAFLCYGSRGGGSGLRWHRRPAQSGSLDFLGHSVFEGILA